MRPNSSTPCRKSPPPIPILSPLNFVHAQQGYICKIYFQVSHLLTINAELPGPFPSRLRTKIYKHFRFLLFVLHAPPISSSLNTAPQYCNNLWILSSWRNVSNTGSVVVSVVNTSDPKTVEILWRYYQRLHSVLAPSSQLIIYLVSHSHILIYVPSKPFICMTLLLHILISVDFIALRTCKSRAQLKPDGYTVTHGRGSERETCEWNG